MTITRAAAQDAIQELKDLLPNELQQPLTILRARIHYLEAALKPFANCDARSVSPSCAPKEQWLWKPDSNFRETRGISLQNIFDARQALELYAKEDANHDG